MRLLGALAIAVLLHAATPAPAQQPVDPDQPALISADQVTYDEALNIVSATGNVEISQSGRVLLADTVTYNMQTEVVSASGNVSLLEPTGEVLFADFVELTGDLREGVVKNIRILLTDKSRVAASNATRVGGNKTVMRRAVFSPCELCQEDPSRAPLWQIKAARVVHDQEKKTIAYSDAWMEVFGIPVIYTPYFEHPDPTVKRKSGFLAPTVGSSDSLGATTQIPYFWAIGPDRDVTFEPIFTTDQNIVLAGEYRQLLRQGRLDLGGSGTIAERRKSNGDVEDNALRGHIDSEGRFDINDTWRWGFDLQRASDDTYLRLYNFSGTRTLTTAAFAEGFRGRNYLAVNNFLYQGLRASDDNDEAPIILPMLDYNFVSEPGLAGGRYTLDANALVLHRFEGRESRRISVKGGWELPYTSPLGDTYKITAQAQADGYWVDGFDENTPNIVNPAGSQSDVLTGRFFPQLAFQWSYPWLAETGDISHVIEPIGQAVLAPGGANPDAIPNEDSQDFEFDDTDLFSLNRFPGLDRVDSGTRFVYGLKWDVFTPEFGDSSAFVGQSYRLENSDVIPTGSGLDSNFSDYVGRVELAPSEYLDLSYRFRLDKEDLNPIRNELDAILGPDALNLQVSYFDISEAAADSEFVTREELNVSVRSKLSEHWSAFVSHRRDLQTDESLSTGGGITYQDECIVIDLVGTRSFFRDREIEPEDAIFVRFVFKHLGEFGNR